MAWHSTLARCTRPLRRRLAPGRFKETYINEFLDRRPNSLYAEIGVRTGESLRRIHSCRKVGIDPIRTPEMQTLLPGELFFEKTSDAFFAEDAAAVFAGTRIDAALVDGLHEFEQALRDILGLERYMSPDGVIFVDDCNPSSKERASETSTGGVWNGDVWKIAPFLLQERADLGYFTIDADHGLGVVYGFRPVPPQLPGREVVSRYKELDYSYLACHRTDSLRLVRRAPLTQLLARSRSL